MLKGLSKVTFFGAHTDDEMICAGTLHRLARNGCEVQIVSFGPAAIKKDRCGGDKSLAVVIDEWRLSRDLIGACDKSKCIGMMPSANLAESGQQICQFVYDWVERERPDACFVLSPDDENTAHAVVGRECERVMRGRVPHVIRCQYPWNYSIGRANLFVRLDEEDVRVKRQVIDAYRSQHFRYNYDKMLMSAVVMDGLSVKVPAAEKFELIRSVI
jgi:LmbE family N-acetylglucosaminyl deacetylase